MTFSPEEDINLAFSGLSGKVTSILCTVNFQTLARAIIERARSPKSHLKVSIVNSIVETANSSDDVLTRLTGTPYWSCLDIRLMEVMANASGIPVIIQSIKNYKMTFYDLPLCILVPEAEVVVLKQDGTTPDSVKNLRQMTVNQLYTNRFICDFEQVEGHLDDVVKIKIVLAPESTINAKRKML